MTGFNETVEELVRRQALSRNVTYGTVKTYARSGRHNMSRLLAEVMRRCGEYGLDMKRMTSSVPEHMRARKELQQFFPPRVPKKRGRKKSTAQRQVPKRTWAKRAEKEPVSLPVARDRWAQAHGYRNWTHYSLEMLARNRGYKDVEEFGRALRKSYGEEYLAYTAGLMRGGFEAAEARKLADLVFSKRYAIPRRRLSGEAKRLAALPLLPPAEGGRFMDTSLPRYKKVWRKFNLPKYRKQWKK